MFALKKKIALAKLDQHFTALSSSVSETEVNGLIKTAFTSFNQTRLSVRDWLDSDLHTRVKQDNQDFYIFPLVQHVTLNHVLKN